MMTIYENRMELTEKYIDVLKLIEMKNKKSDGTSYDKGVLFDMLVADYKAHVGNQELPYPFEGDSEFKWEQFGADLKEL